MTFDFKLPDLGEGIREAEILGVKVNEGQTIAEDQALFEVETDKAVVEIPSPVAGKVLKVNVKTGQIVPVGTVMVSIDDGSFLSNKSASATSGNKTSKVISGSTEPSPAMSSPAMSGPRMSSPTIAANSAAISAASAGPAIATPATRQLARELKIDLHLVPGSGPGGRISREDVLTYAENKQGKKAVSGQPAIGTESGAKPEPVALPDFSKFGKIERVPIKSLRRKTAQLMALSWARIPHVTHGDEADVTQLEAFRKKHEDLAKQKGVKLTFTAFVMKAAVMALQAFPELNTSYDEQAEEIVFKYYYNIGMAVATDRGLIVPVIESVDKKSIIELAVDINRIAEKARAAKIELHELQGATFTITNIGAIGGISATPIIHYPEAAILAVMKTKETPIVRNGKIESALMMPLYLAFDHRLTDGAQVAHFVREIVKMLEDPSSFEKCL